ncbi:MAG TPA: hypothetical protein VGG51_01365 [Candidatus Cybelea sp.]|jgi:hypothetical protein
MTKLTVLTNDAGTIVAAHVGRTGASSRNGSVIMIGAAQPGQKLHKTEFEMPQITSLSELERFHKELAKHLSAA